MWRRGLCRTRLFGQIPSHGFSDGCSSDVERMEKRNDFAGCISVGIDAFMRTGKLCVYAREVVVRPGGKRGVWGHGGHGGRDPSPTPPSATK